MTKRLNAIISPKRHVLSEQVHHRLPFAVLRHVEGPLFDLIGQVGAGTVTPRDVQ